MKRSMVRTNLDSQPDVMPLFYRDFLFQLLDSILGSVVRFEGGVMCRMIASIVLLKILSSVS